MLCGWDGEESGLIGSVEHVEEFYGQLRDKAIAYINIDSAVYGMQNSSGIYFTDQILSQTRFKICRL